MVFTDEEIRYLGEQRLGRLATVDPDGAPQNSPVGFVCNTVLGTIDIFGWNMSASRKYRNITADPRVSFVVDDFASRDPLQVRGVEIRGRAECVRDPAAAAEWRARLDAAPYARVREFPATDDVIRIHPRRVLAWGLTPGAVEIRARDVPDAGAGQPENATR